jgi:hypothetical protein
MITDETFDLSRFFGNTEQPQQGSVLTLELIDGLLETMYASAHAEPPLFLISPATAKLIWRLGRIAKLNEVCPLPQRKLRKCIMRKVYAKRHKAMQRIRRKEQSGAWMLEIGRGGRGGQ